MSDKSQNLVLEQLRYIRAKVDSIQHEMRDGFSNANTRLAAIEQHMSGFHATIGAHSAEINELRKRIERIERRLELIDD